VSFFAEQARNRRVSWLLAVFAVTAVIVTGIPLGLVGAPLLFLAVMPLALVMTTIRPHSAWGILLVVPATLLPNIFGFGHQASTATYANAQAVLAAHGVWPVVIATVGLAVVRGRGGVPRAPAHRAHRPPPFRCWRPAAPTRRPRA
jgi:hypothetical protein